MVGFSNGGMMTCRYAAEHTEMLAAAAPIAASIGGRPNADAPEWCIPAPEKQLPILIMHGLDDDDIPFAGGVSILRKGERTYLSVPTSVQFWIDPSGCQGAPIVFQPISMTRSNSHRPNLEFDGPSPTATAEVMK